MPATLRSSALRLAVVGLAASVCLVGAAQAEEPAPVLVHLGHYSDDLHAASMALGIANLLQGQGVPVTIFLDREGVRLADARVPQNLAWADAPTIAERYQSFVKGGGAILLCSHCAKAAGIEAGNLRSGAKLGTDETIAAAFLGAAKVIDY